MGSCRSGRIWMTEALSFAVRRVVFSVVLRNEKGRK